MLTNIKKEKKERKEINTIKIIGVHGKKMTNYNLADLKAIGRMAKRRQILRKQRHNKSIKYGKWFLSKKGNRCRYQYQYGKRLGVEWHHGGYFSKNYNKGFTFFHPKSRIQANNKAKEMLYETKLKKQYKGYY